MSVQFPLPLHTLSLKHSPNKIKQLSKFLENISQVHHFKTY